jgi:hypothetical protein
MSAVIAKKWYHETIADVEHDDAFMQHYIIDTEMFEEDIKQMLEVCGDARACMTSRIIS